MTVVTALGIQQQDNSAERMVSQAIGVGRILWGATTAIASKQVYNVLGIAYPGSDLGVWIKAFGVRDIVLGAAALSRLRTAGSRYRQSTLLREYSAIILRGSRVKSHKTESVLVLQEFSSARRPA